MEAKERKDSLALMHNANWKDFKMSLTCFLQLYERILDVVDFSLNWDIVQLHLSPCGFL